MLLLLLEELTFRHVYSKTVSLKCLIIKLYLECKIQIKTSSRKIMMNWYAGNLVIYTIFKCIFTQIS